MLGVENGMWRLYGIRNSRKEDNNGFKNTRGLLWPRRNDESQKDMKKGSWYPESGACQHYQHPLGGY